MSTKNINQNITKISDIEEHIRAFNERKRKLIEQNKLTVYDNEGKRDKALPLL